MPPPPSSLEIRVSALEKQVASLTATKADTAAMLVAIKAATDPLKTAIAALSITKADATALSALGATVQTLADAVTALHTALDTKADAADLAALQAAVSTLEKQVAYLIGVYNPNQNPPQQVAQDLTPDSVTFSDQASGYIFTAAASGGVPDSYTYALTGPDAGLFSIDSGTGAVSAPSPITAGNYDISVQATNAKGTATFPIAITTTGDVFATPSESTLPSQTLCLDARVGGLWHVAASIVQSGITYTTNVPGFIVGASLGADPKNVQLALAGKGPTVVRVPGGNFSFTQGANFASGKTYWIGTVDGDGQPTTVFTGSTGSSIAFSSSATDPNTEGWVKDILIGPTDQQLIDNGITYQQGGRALQFGGAGHFSVINVVIRNVAEVGLYGNTANEWLSRTSLQVWVYDSEISGCGTNAQEHNVYWHCGLLAFIRSVTRDTRGSHALKADCEKAIILDSRLLRDTGIGLKGPNNHSAALNYTPACDMRMARNLIQHVDPSTTNISVMEVISRGNSGGGFSLKTPPAENIENDIGAVRDPDGMLGHWASNSFAPGVSKNIIAVAAAAAATGATSVTLKFIASEGYKATRNLSLGVTYSGVLQLSDLTVQPITTIPSAVGSGTATIPISGGVNAPGIAANAKVFLKVSTDPVDYRDVNPRFWQKGSAGYWWDEIRSGSALDLTKQDLFNTSYVQDNMWLINTPANSVKIFQQSTDAFFQYAGNQEGTRANIPFAPINRPGGAIMDWPDVAGRGSWAQPLAGNGYPYYGRNPNTSDFVFAFPVFWKDNGVARVAGTIGEQFQQTVTGGTYDALGDIRWLDSGGTLNQVLSTTVNRNPLGPFITSSLSSQGNSGSHTVQVASIAGLTSGMKFQIDMQAPRGSLRTLHITTINGAPSGNTVTMADALPMNVPSGSATVGFGKAGADPATWIPPSDYATR